MTQAAIRKAFMTAVHKQRALVDQKIVAASVQPGFVLIRAVQGLYASEPWTELQDPLTQAFFAGAYKEEKVAVKAISLARRLALEWAQNRAGLMIMNLKRDNVAVIQAATANAIATNGTVAEVAVAIKNDIGLLPRDVRAIRNLRVSMRADGMSARQIEKAVEARRKKAINARALAIARTEMVAAREQGKLQAWIVRASEGKLVDVKRKWHTLDPCPTCAALGALAPVPLNQPFRLNGREYWAPPVHTNCKCKTALVKQKQ